MYGWLVEDLGARSAVVFVLAWLAGLLLPFVPYGDALFTPLVAVVDIVLVLIIFKGDVRL